MSGNPKLHIIVSYRENDTDITASYAASEQVLQEAELWELKTISPTAKAFVAWLKEHGCKLDCQDGPALIERSVKGMDEQYFENGQLHRSDGPARVVRAPDGSIVWESYYRHDRFVLREQLAPLSRIAGVAVRGIGCRVEP